MHKFFIIFLIGVAAMPSPAVANETAPADERAYRTAPPSDNYFSGGARDPLCEQFARVELALLEATEERPFAFQVSNLSAPTVFRATVTDPITGEKSQTWMTVEQDAIAVWHDPVARGTTLLRTVSLPCDQSQPLEQPSFALIEQDMFELPAN